MIGLFGYVCRLGKYVKSKDCGQAGDHIRNTEAAENIIELGPTMPAKEQKAPVPKRGRGRPCVRPKKCGGKGRAK